MPVEHRPLPDLARNTWRKRSAPRRGPDRAVPKNLGGATPNPRLSPARGWGLSECRGRDRDLASIRPALAHLYLRQSPPNPVRMLAGIRLGIATRYSVRPCLRPWSRIRAIAVPWHTAWASASAPSTGAYVSLTGDEPVAIKARTRIRSTPPRTREASTAQAA